MRQALHAFPYILEWKLGTVSGHETQLDVQPVFETPYYVPKGALLGEQFNLKLAYGPVLYTNYSLQIPEAAVKSSTLPHPTIKATDSDADSGPSLAVKYLDKSRATPGAVEGIFAIPVHGTRKGGLIYEDQDIEAWEPDKRGIYYLGKDLDDCERREWTFLGEIEVVEVISYEEED
ncbi:hypothetical protein BU26DRAFT_600377 [Trematosphaeria pertusa]|uniref:Uncharacterized protein n=1 Tax=Trematosphaeria pertusa TaxID=390896 RepID=A0A6A6IWC0_9PLEO|nr:uncharacterized protein BU26DRAFT_600377 [Trematosphaeria pertusa]KAF2254739.1 hypothetical protein BU26DRAFT_600377 [Trematosphaeria pertusa]